MKQLRLTDFKATRQVIEIDHHGNDSEAESFGFFDVPSDDEEEDDETTLHSKQKKWDTIPGVVQNHLKDFQVSMLTDGISKIYNSHQVAAQRNQKAATSKDAEKLYESIREKFQFWVNPPDPDNKLLKSLKDEKIVPNWYYIPKVI